MDDKVKPRVALFISNLGGGGVQNVIINLAGGLIIKGVTVDLVVGKAQGRNEQKTPQGVNLIDLNQKKVLLTLPGLLRYLFSFRPTVLMTAQTHVNIVGIIAKLIYGKKLRLIICEHNDMQAVLKTFPKERYRPLLARWLYPIADEIVAVSQGVAESLTTLTGLPGKKIRILHNPLVSEEMLLKAKEHVSHPWFQVESPHVALAVGRLEVQKDFETLLQAIALINQHRFLRLVILGEGIQREKLISLAKNLGIREKVDLPGYVDNPYSYMNKSSVFVLSSRFEGFPGVLVEAIACGVPVVSTDCPSGPAEILESGRIGRLVSVGDAVEMAAAIEDSLDNPFPIEESRKRAWDFSIVDAVEAYLDILLPECGEIS